MAISRVGSIGGGVQGSQSTLNVTTTATAEVGNVVFAIIASDNRGGETSDGEDYTNITSITNTGNTFTKLKSFTNAQTGDLTGAVAELWYCVVANEITSGETITLNIPGGTGRIAVEFEEYTGFTSTPTVPTGGYKTSAGDVTTPGGSVTLDSALSALERVWIRIIGAEDGDATISGNTSGWTNVTSRVSGSGASGCSLLAETKISSATNETSNPTTAGGTSDWASLLIAIQDGAGDTTPDAFSFTDATNQNRSTLVTSNSINISGINAATAVSLTGTATNKEFRIAGGSWVTSGNITNGQSLEVRGTSSSAFNTAVTIIVDVGGVTDTFSITTGGSQSYSFTIGVTDSTPGTPQTDSLATSITINAAAEPPLADVVDNVGIYTFSGFGMVPLGLPEDDTITGTGASDWRIDYRGNLVPSGTYGTAKSFSKTAGQIYSLTLSDGRTCAITMVADRADWIGVMSGENADTASSHQLQTYANASGGLARGRTMFGRTGGHWNWSAGANTPSFTLTIDPTKITGSSGNVIIKAETALGVKMGIMKLVPAAVGNYQLAGYYLEFDGLFFNAGVTTATAASAHGTCMLQADRVGSGAAGKCLEGVIVRNCRFETQIGAGVTDNNSRSGIYYNTRWEMYDNTFDYIGYGMRARNHGDGSCSDVIISGAELSHYTVDPIQVGLQSSTGNFLIEDVYAHTPTDYQASHGDLVHLFGNSVCASLPNVTLNRVYCQLKTGVAGQHAVQSTNFLTGAVTNFVATNLYLEIDMVTGVKTEYMDSPTIQRSSLLNQVGSAANNCQILGSTGFTGTGVFNDNIANSFPASGGAYVWTGSNNTVARGAYASSLEAATHTTAMGTVMTVWAPIANGTHKNGNGTYKSCFFPKDLDGSCRVNDGTVWSQI